MRSFGFMAVISLSFLTRSFPAGAALPGEQYADFAPDGAWCWFADPRAVSHHGHTYAGWVTSKGDIQVGDLEHRSGSIRIATLHAGYQRDDHDNPALLFLPDGRVMVFYSKHCGPDMNSRVTVRPFDLSDWEEERTLDLHGESRVRKNITYPNPVNLSAESNTIHLFWRGDDWKPTVSRSTDAGRTWSPGREVVRRKGAGSANRPYVKIASNDRDRIHMVFTDGHPRDEARNSVYYACYRDGAFHRADGARIAGTDSLPFEPGDADCVYDGAATGVRAWVWDVASDAEDQPVIAYARLPSETDHRYHYARWDGKAWIDRELVPAGKWFPETPAGAKEREPHYSGGIALDHADPSHVYLSAPVDGVFEIERWQTSDAGRNWSKTAVTAGSKFNNVRPVVVRRHEVGGPTVLWVNNDGGYRHYTDYRGRVKQQAFASDRPGIPSGDVWLDADGRAIEAHGGGILVRGTVYYWYGEDRRSDGAGSVTCYSSTNLHDWKREGVALARSALPVVDGHGAFVERPKVLFNARTGKYVMWMHLEQGRYQFARAGIAISDSPTRPFSFLKAIRPVPNTNDFASLQPDPNRQGEFGATFRDMNLFMDDDGKAYVFYAAEDNHTMYVVRLNDEFTGPELPLAEGRTWARVRVGAHREAPAPFKFKGRYYLITSACTGWTANAADYAVAEDILGPYEARGNPCVGAEAELTFRAQSTFVLPMPGRPNGFLFMADRWNPGNLADSRYLWLPFEMKDDGTFELRQHAP
jgi:hypothetical protein